MNWLDEVNKPKGKAPIRVLIYGIEGVGKSTFGAGAPNPIFISAEGGTSQIKGAKEMPRVRSWDDVIDAVAKLTNDKHPFETVVLDSADWIEKMCHAKIIGESKKDIIRVNGGYGAGYRDSERLHRELIDALTNLVDKRQMNVVVTAHYHVKVVKDPDAAQDYDAFQIKCHEYVSALWREWVDAILFARFETLVKVDDEKDKARAMGTGERVMYTQHRPSFQAKNRYGLPFEMPVSWSEFEKAARGCDPVAELKKELEVIIEKAEGETAHKIQLAVNNAGDDEAKLASILKHAIKVVK